MDERELENDVLKLMKQGQYDPFHIFNILYAKYPVHYSKIREAIHNAKQK
jgi:hypothetical protein